MSVTLNFDMARYADALQAMEKGTKMEHEAYLLMKYPPDMQILLDRPVVVLDKYGIIVMWYLPGAIDPAIKVSAVDLPIVIMLTISA